LKCKSGKVCQKFPKRVILGILGVSIHNATRLFSLPVDYSVFNITVFSDSGVNTLLNELATLL
jgi:hypothetical protein